MKKLSDYPIKDQEVWNHLLTIDAARVFQNISKKELCSRAEITVVHYDQCLKGKSIPSIPVLRLLASGVNLILDLKLTQEKGFFDNFIKKKISRRS